MRLGIMQPYFIPYIGYWQLMKAVDLYVIYDDVNFINRGWINRNRIIDGKGAYMYVNVPLSNAGQNRLIYQLNVHSDRRILMKGLRAIRFQYAKAPYFSEIYPICESIFSCRQERLIDFLYYSFECIRSYLDISTPMILSSEIEKNQELHGEDRILNICETLHATKYMNAVGGKSLYNRERFKENGIQLEFIEADIAAYSQLQYPFLPGLSIIDVMMFNPKSIVKNMLNQFTIY